MLRPVVLQSADGDLQPEGGEEHEEGGEDDEPGAGTAFGERGFGSWGWRGEGEAGFGVCWVRGKFYIVAWRLFLGVLVLGVGFHFLVGVVEWSMDFFRGFVGAGCWEGVCWACWTCDWIHCDSSGQPDTFPAFILSR